MNPSRLQPLALLLLAGTCGPRASSAQRPVRQPLPGDAIAVTLGSAHTCALSRRGEVRCWGANTYGQLGDGTLQDHATPVPVAGLSEVSAIGAGAHHTCALHRDGGVSCWGLGSRGELGAPGAPQRSTARRVAGVRDARELVVSEATSCALRRSGGVQCWGALAAMLAGDGTTATEMPGLLNVRSLALGSDVALAWRADGAVVGWGASRVLDAVMVPDSVARPAPPRALRELAVLRGTRLAGLSGPHGCVRTQQGALACWRSGLYDASHPLLDYPLYASAVPEVSASARVVVGPMDACAFEPGGPLHCWGAHAHEWGGGARAPAPRGSWNDARGIVAAGFGESHQCLVSEDGAPWCWGSNTRGQLGEGTQTQAHASTVTLPVPAAQLAAGTWHVCARLIDGRIACWGQCAYGQLGVGDAARYARPVVLTGLGRATDVAAHSQHSCALVDGEAWCWGALPSPLRVRADALALRPTRIEGASGLTQLALGAQHACALRSDGRVLCWGENHASQLGDGTRTPRAQPAVVVGLERVRALAAGDLFTCALREDGEALCWGRPHTFATAQERAVPTRLASEVAQLALGPEHACVLGRDGATRCFGRLLELPAPNDRPELFAEPRGAGARRLSATGMLTCAHGADALRCWGIETAGEVGAVSGHRGQLREAEVAGFSGAVELVGGMGFLCARDAAGAVSCRGASAHGEAGDGTADRDAPVRVVW